ncbi:hypothetical protein AAVH_26659 [Aphelenchoides avenae]|nr:hypothetical protein AAVH_26659 [Aphelenchus avenae]
MAIYQNDPGTEAGDESASKMFHSVLNTFKRIGKPIDMDAIGALYSQRVYVIPEGDTAQLRELRAIVEALLTGNATTPTDDERTTALTELSSLYGIVLVKLLNSALPSSTDKPPFKLEALVEEMQWVDGLFELTYRRSDGTRPLDVEQRHLDAVEELLKFHVQETHSKVKDGKFPASFLKTIQDGLAGLKKRKLERDADYDDESTHEEF